jgi:hypothetical protein
VLNEILFAKDFSASWTPAFCGGGLGGTFLSPPPRGVGGWGQRMSTVTASAIGGASRASMLKSRHNEYVEIIHKFVPVELILDAQLQARCRPADGETGFMFGRPRSGPPAPHSGPAYIYATQANFF